ncbi:MAG: hypothetical protein LBN24_12205 [Mediterranea sp.]|jgi:hypothetical protein|nr:hypothetical protein [Mediterranea sp.]
MVFYNNCLARLFLRHETCFFMVCGLVFVRSRYLEVWDEMEIRIHTRQFWECFLLALLPSLFLSLCVGWMCMLLPFFSYHIFYWTERAFRSQSSFDWEAKGHHGDAIYMRKRKAFVWMRWYGRKELPYVKEWND